VPATWSSCATAGSPACASIPTATPLERLAVGEYTGSPDPRPGIPGDLPPHVDVSVSYSADGQLGFVGWSVRQPPVWQAGIVVVDLVGGRVVQRMALPDVSTGPADAIVQAFAPKLAVSIDGGRALISRDSYVVDAGTLVYRSGTAHFMADVAAARLGPLAAFASTGACPDGQADAGFGSDGQVWLACWSRNGHLSVRRLAQDGSLRDEIPGDISDGVGIWAVAPNGAAIYLWAPTTRLVSRLDLTTGQVTSATAPAPTGTAGFGPLAAVGRWLAPPAAAKVFLQPGIVLSADGSKLYALGIAPEFGGLAGSTGVFSFDSASLAPLGNWAPTADFVSITVSRDGRFVYAAGVAGVDASGAPSGFGASITVYDTSDGSVRLVAGQLGHDEDLLFPSPILP
jgi:hypothetical protein